MKKTFITASVLGALISANSFAKTEGNYVGLDLINTKVQNLGNVAPNGKEYDSTGFGINYKYAFNYYNVFLAPSISYDDNRATIGSSVATDTGELRYSFGVKLDLGYDITDQVGLFLRVGYSDNRITTNVVADGIANDTTIRNSSREAFLYGIGGKYSINDRIDINLAYEVSDFQGTHETTYNTAGDDYKVARIGVSYNF